MLGNSLTGIAVEMLCNKHGFERFRIKIIKKFNMPSNLIVPELSKRPTVGEIKCIYIGRDVNPNEVEKYLVNYFRDKGVLQNIIKMHLIT